MSIPPALATILLVLTAAAASAHPGYRPSEIAAGDTVEVELVLAHDCEGQGGESPTTVVELDVPPGIAEIEPIDVPGWTASATDDGAGQRRIEWVAAEEREPGNPPVFGLRLTAASASETTTVPTRVYQGCEDGEYRWGVAEGEPSVDLTVTPGTYVPPSEAVTPSPTAVETTSSAPVTTERSEAESTSELSDGPEVAASSSPDASAPLGNPQATLLWWLGGLVVIGSPTYLWVSRREKTD